MITMPCECRPLALEMAVWKDFLSVALKAPCSTVLAQRLPKAVCTWMKVRVIFVFCEHEGAALPNWASELGNNRVYSDNMAGGGIR